MTSEVIAGLAHAAQNRAIPTPTREPDVKIALLVLVLAVFGALSALAVADHGIVGIFAHALQNTAGMQVLADLVIALTLVMIWMIADARRTGRTVWPWLLLTLAAGSFGPLGYLLVGAVRERRGRTAPLAAGAR
jgi:hypothetical protein